MGEGRSLINQINELKRYNHQDLGRFKTYMFASCMQVYFLSCKFQKDVVCIPTVWQIFDFCTKILTICG